MTVWAPYFPRVQCGGGLMYLLSFKIVLKALFNNNIYKIQQGRDSLNISNSLNLAHHLALSTYRLLFSVSIYVSPIRLAAGPAVLAQYNLWAIESVIGFQPTIYGTSTTSALAPKAIIFGVLWGFFRRFLGGSLGVLGWLLADSWLILGWLLADSWLTHGWLLADSWLTPG